VVMVFGGHGLPVTSQTTLRRRASYKHHLPLSCNRLLLLTQLREKFYSLTMPFRGIHSIRFSKKEKE
jgi:hypothetical protein